MAKSANKTTAAMVRKAKDGKGTLSFTPKKSPAKKPGVSGDQPKKGGKSPFGK